MAKIFLICFVFIIPIFGKTLDYSESIIFYSIPIIFSIYNLLNKKIESKNTNHKIIWAETTLIALYIISTIFSKNIGTSYYQLFIFITVVLTANLFINFIDPSKFQKYLIGFSFIYSIVFLLNKIKIIHLNVNPTGDNFVLQVWGHSYISDLIVFTIPILISQISKKNYIKILPLLLFFIVTLILTNSRSSLLALLIGLFFVFPANPLLKKIKKITIFTTIIGFGLIFLLISSNQLSNKSIFGNRPEYWRESLISFSQNPILGYGPGTFSNVNQKLQSNPSISTDTPHSSLLLFMGNNGIIFTIIIFGLIFLGLKKNYSENKLFFICGLIAITNSLFDPTWDSPGIFLISLYFIFYEYFKFQNKSINKSAFFFNYSVSTLLIIFFISKTSSDSLFLKQNYRLSSLIDPFNINPRISLINQLDPSSSQWQKNTQNTIKLFNQENLIYKSLIEKIALPQSEKYFYSSFNLKPLDNNILYVSLLKYYLETNQFEKIKSLSRQINNTFTSNDQYKNNFNIDLAKIYYQIGLHYFSEKPNDSLLFIEKASYLYPGLSYLYVELARGYSQSNLPGRAYQELNNICTQNYSAKKQCLIFLNDHPDGHYGNLGSQDYPNIIQYASPN